MYLVRSGGAQNYAVYDVLLNFFARSTDFLVPETLISPAKITCGKGKLVFARF